MKEDNKTGRVTKNISVSFKPQLLKKIDAFLAKKENRHLNRSSVIETATEAYLSRVPCEVCGRLVDDDKYCSHCGCLLDISTRDREIANYLYLEQHPEHAPNPSGNKVIVFTLSDSEIRNLLAGNMVPECENLTVVDRKTYRKNVQEYLENRKKKNI